MISSTEWVKAVSKSKDAIVQVFVEVSKFNWFEPYRPPQLVSGESSGFFIDQEGHIVTNFHVVDGASSIKIQIPSLGKEQLGATIVGVYPEMDVALIKLTDESLSKAKSSIGELPFLKLGDSDQVFRTQRILALGYPLGGQSLKSTQGIVSGFEKLNFATYIQTTAPLNPGNSGGPSINEEGEVVGINFAGVAAAQNVGFIIPINDVKVAMRDLLKIKLLRKPYLGGIFTYVNDDLISYLNNPSEGGFYIAEVFEGSVMQKAGIISGDMIYEVNKFKIDKFGEITAPWAEDKISLFDLLNRLPVGEPVEMVAYRNGKRCEITFDLERGAILPVRIMYPEYEDIDYEVFGGMTLMQLTLNHVNALVERNPLFYRFMKIENQDEPRLIITSIFPDSQAYNSRSIEPSYILSEVNGKPVKTLDDFRSAILEGSEKKDYVTFRFENKAFAVLSIKKIIDQEKELADIFKYKPSVLTQKLVGS